jgi:hypothetical protein
LFCGNGEEDHELGTVMSPTERNNKRAFERADFTVIAFTG